MSEYYREWSKKRKGLCRSCTNQATGCYCDECKQKKKDWYELRKKQGLCRHCPQAIAPSSTCLCKTCLRKNAARAKKDPMARWFRSIKTRAKHGNVPLTITKAEFLDWLGAIPRHCYYCGVDEVTLSRSKSKKACYTIDRMDNARGYELSNICLACFRCNNLKSNFFTAEEWKQIAEQYIKRRIQEYHAAQL